MAAPSALLARNRSRWLTALGMILFSTHNCRDPGPEARVFSVVRDDRTVSEIHFPDHSSITLVKRLALPLRKGVSGAGPRAVADVALDERGLLYVVDPSAGRVFILDKDGAHIGSVGSPGTEARGLLSPSSAVLVEGSLAVLDIRLGQIKVYDRSGEFLRAFPAPRRARYMERGPGHTLLVVTTVDTVVAYQLDLFGNVSRAYFSSPLASRQTEGQYEHDPGRVCADSNQVVYANPWMSELVAIDPQRAGYSWVKRYDTRVLRPYQAQVGLRQRAAILGLECTRDFIILAYIDRQTSEVTYDLLDRNGIPKGRLQFMRDTDDLPGFIASSAGNQLVSFRTRLRPEVSLYSIEAN